MQLRLPKSIPSYLVAAVKRVGLMKQGTTKNMAMERSGTEEADELLKRLQGLEVEQREVEMRMVEDEKRKQRRKALEDELRRIEEVDGKDTGDGQVVSGKISGDYGMGIGYADGDGPRQRHFQRGNRRRRPVMEDTSSDNSDPDFDPTPAITSPTSAQTQNKKMQDECSIRSHAS
jgi:hypothetical protein